MMIIQALQQTAAAILVHESSPLSAAAAAERGRSISRSNKGPAALSSPRSRVAIMTIMQALQKLAWRFPQAQQGIACAGTAAECRTVTAGNKAFLFLGKTEARLKLRDSLSEASNLASKAPGHYEVGAHGWIKLTIADDEFPPLELLERWIDESYRLLAPNKLVALLPQRSSPSGEAKQAAKKTAPKKLVKKKGQSR